MNANSRGTMFVKGDRINLRVEDYAKMFLSQDTITQQDFKDFVKGVHIIIDTELNDKGVERKWIA